MKKFFVAMMLCVFSSSAFAECYGTGGYRHCQDNAGNQYDISKFGNMTTMHGYNFRTGSDWSETAYKFGNTTNIEGQDSHGNRWNENITTMGNYMTIDGRDARGRYFHKDCYRNFDGSMNCN